MKIHVSIVLGLLLLAGSCTSLVKEKEITALQELQYYLYQTRVEIKAGSKRLARGKKVKIIIRVDDDWIKVYGYDYNSNLLKSERVLILYLFRDDFKDKVFSKDLFEIKLQKYLKTIKKLKIKK